MINKWDNQKKDKKRKPINIYFQKPKNTPKVNFIHPIMISNKLLSVSKLIKYLRLSVHKLKEMINQVFLVKQLKN